MVIYQNIFTRIQVRPPTPYPGVKLPPDDVARDGKPRFVHLFGRFGDAQIGPIYLGILGLTSLVFGTIAFLIIGFNMLAQVNWNFFEFIRQLFWLALEPPPAKYGLQFPPMREGGWWLVAGFFLTVSILLWWARTYRRARQLGMGTHVAWAFAATI
jgi:photosynthetic reaction center M subunit